MKFWGTLTSWNPLGHSRPVTRLLYILWAGQRIEFRWGARFSEPVQTGPGAHPASCTMGTGSFPRIKSGRGVTLTPHPLLVPWSRKSRAISLFPLSAVQCLYKGALYLYLFTLHSKENIKVTRPHSYFLPSINTYPLFSERKASQDSRGIFPSPKITKLRARVTTKLHGEVLTSSPVIQKKEQKAKRMKNNFKKMVHSPNWSNSDKNGETDC